MDQESTTEVCYELLPEWKGIDICITQLSGGIANKLYRIQSGKGDYTVRIYGEKTDLFINCDCEAHSIREMAKTVYRQISSNICQRKALPSWIHR
ncbi:MAG: hypothetical protein QGE94_01270 [Desulfobacterales bacterium]|nr:hypothetical protein [Desulfobacterales bacterium]